MTGAIRMADSELGPEPAVPTAEEAAAAAGDSGIVIHYHFPVEVEIRTTAGPVDREELHFTTLDRLATEFGNC